MNALVAERVFGRKWQVSLDDRSPFSYLVIPDGTYTPTVVARRRDGVLDGYYGPDYSGDIAAAWTVVEKLRERGIYIDVEATPEGYEVIASWLAPREGGGERWRDTDLFTLASAPHAICLAALAALTSETAAHV